jgi:quercetin dioxygenase-like cupin family protein
LFLICCQPELVMPNSARGHPDTRRARPRGAFGRHWNPGEEIVYVLEGSLEYEVEGKPPVMLKAGEVLFIPAGTIHAAKNVGSGNGAELATYVVEKGKPLVVMVK